MADIVAEFAQWFQETSLFPLERAHSGQIVSAAKEFIGAKGYDKDDEFDLLEEVFAMRNSVSSTREGIIRW